MARDEREPAYRLSGPEKEVTCAEKELTGPEKEFPRPEKDVCVGDGEWIIVV
ncbi:hypothetical protein FIBSPDRAFT_854299 [Athelia psychrophila]|uniref:Uncharacterized protein n=1 Tax=Athelia psychrophila TaxID=1759441 RepID=A0A166QB25_9AGAM|nr:hypothetical protein FIBSPDRAFT_854299 [Fibularhizoctonia sp. CBS 109695]